MNIARLVSRKTEETTETKADPFEARLTSMARTGTQASDRPSPFTLVKKSQ